MHEYKFALYVHMYILQSNTSLFVHMLTDKQQKVYDAIRSYMDNHRYAPTLEELQSMLELKNKHSVVQFLDYLEDKGYIERERGYR